jgi:hypothetical protein
MKHYGWMFLAAVMLVGGSASAQTSKVDQGGPGTQGPWLQTPPVCLAMVHTVTAVGVAATNCPASQLTGRRFIILCNSAENAAAPKVKIRIDGTNPVMGVTNVGDVLAVGDCVTYYLRAATVPKCIADTASTAVTALECK